MLSQLRCDGTSGYRFEYYLHLIKIPSHLNRESIYMTVLQYVMCNVTSNILSQLKLISARQQYSSLLHGVASLFSRPFHCSVFLKLGSAYIALRNLSVFVVDAVFMHLKRAEVQAEAISLVPRFYQAILDRERFALAP